MCCGALPPEIHSLGFASIFDMRAVLVLLLVVLDVSTALRTQLHALRMAAISETSVSFLKALQNGEAPEDLRAFVDTEEREACKFFAAYLTDDEWTIADATEPPQILIDSLEVAAPSVLDDILMRLLVIVR